MKTTSKRRKSNPEDVPVSFRLKKWTVLFIILTVVTVFLTLILSNVSFYLSGNPETAPGSGVHWSYEVFFGLIAGIVITLVVVDYVTHSKKK